jgi:Cu/Ag efflux pump CusA
MLNKLIQFSLRNRLFVIAVAALVMVYGVFTLVNLPVDVLPDLNRPRVTIFLEAHGMAPEEIESQILVPTETSLNGSPGVEVVRSVASPGLGLVFVEFGWNTDIYRARQLTAEKLQTVQLPPGITPVMGPISSVMGQIMLIGVTGTSTTPMDLRTLSDFTIRRRLMSIAGVSQVIPIGGIRMQYQVLVSAAKLRQFNLSIDAVDKALSLTNINTTGGFIEDGKGSEVLIRNIGRVGGQDSSKTLTEIANTAITSPNGAPILLKQVANVKLGGPVKRGDASLNGQPAVILSIEKQPNANTLTVTQDILKALEELKRTLPKDVKVNTDVFQQKHFIQNSLNNVQNALRDGFILVIIILFLFLLNFRTTIITLTAIPLSLIITAIIFKYFDISINTLTLGGLAIAIGELVDDAVVDVENVFRRLKENWNEPNPKPLLQVIYKASSEVRNSIVYATIIVVLVFIPLFSLQGIEGRIFAPLGIAYITSIIASLLVSLTVTPALCSYLLGKPNYLRHVNLKFWQKQDDPALKSVVTEKEELVEKNALQSASHDDSRLVRFLKRKDISLLHFGLKHPKTIIGIAIALIIAAFTIIPFFGTEFLPPFNEGSFTINLSMPAGTSINEADSIGSIAERQMLKVPEVLLTARRTGRAELDEHAEPPSNSEIEVALKPDSKRGRDAILADLREKLAIMQGVSVNVGQPISHRLEHLLSGVRAQVAIKIFGNDLSDLRTYAGQLKDIISKVPGVVDMQIEKQVLVPQLTIKINREAIKRYGLQAGKVAEDIQTIYNGKVSSEVIDGQKTFDINLRTDDHTRNNIDAIKNLQIAAADGSLIPLQQIADIQLEKGINAIYHENTQRRIVISANVQGRDLGTTVTEMEAQVNKNLPLKQGYFIEWGGQFATQKEATKLISILSIFSVGGIFLVLYSHFKSSRIVLQIMLNIPLALIGSVVAVILTGGVFSVATMVGFITLTGIASRNGIMMISHYIHLVEFEGEEFGDKMIIRGSLERLVPVLMTALVAALALIPLTLDASAAGKEILYPVATVILGGLVSSTLLDMVVTPVVFKQFGAKALKQYFDSRQKDVFEG